MAKKIRGKKEGSIWRQGSKWRAAVSLNGKRITRSFKTKSECKAWIHEKQNQIDQGLTFKATKTDLEQFLKEWLAIHKTRLKPKPGERCEQITRDYIVPHLGKYKLHEIGVEHIEGLYQILIQNGVSVRNVRYAHSILHSSFNDAVKRGIVVLNAAHGARQPKLVQREMRILDENQVTQFLISVKDNRNEALYHLAIKTGMRQGELLGLKWADLDWKKGNLRVQRQVQRVTRKGMVFMPPKTRAGRRTIPLGNETLKILSEHWSKQKHDRETAGNRWKELNLIFPSSIGTVQSPSNLSRDFKLLLNEAGLQKMRFHDLRHTAASLMLNIGIPVIVVSKILGHSKPSTTMDIYGHLIPVMHEDLGNFIDDLVTPIPIILGENLDTKNVTGDFEG